MILNVRKYCLNNKEKVRRLNSPYKLSEGSIHSPHNVVKISVVMCNKYIQEKKNKLDLLKIVLLIRFILW